MITLLWSMAMTGPDIPADTIDPYFVAHGPWSPSQAVELGGHMIE